MTKTNFIFLTLFLILLVLSPLLIQLPVLTQNILAIALILLFGIPHGAIDNLLFLDKSKISPIGFFAFYLLAIGLTILAWLIFPVLSLFLFLIISAYHFGQSQFESKFKINSVLGKAFFFLWGSAVISAFIFFNLPELTATINTYQDLAPFSGLIHPLTIKYIFGITTLLSVAFLFVAAILKLIKPESLVTELMVLSITFVSAYLFTFLLGFALFFITIHSFKVMQSEFNHFYQKVDLQTIKKFVLKLLPLTMLSLFGIAALFGLIHLEMINISYPLALQITISAITVPHVYVMEKFYHA